MQRKLASSTNAGLIKLESKLGREWNDLLLQEETLWMQKSQVNLLKLRDKNCKLFHSITLIRRRRNMIEAWMDYNGDWI